MYNNSLQHDVEESVRDYMRVIWITGEVILVLISIFTAYIFISLLHYSWKRRNSVGVSGNVVERRERILRYSCGIAILMAMMRCALHQSILWFTEPGDIATCRRLLTASKAVYNIAICLTYVYLWLRQRNFYTSLELRPLRTRVKEILDWCTLVIIILTSAVVAIIAYVPSFGGERVTYHSNRCTVFEISNKIIMRVYAGLSLMFQLILVLLYVYPIAYRFKLRKMEKRKPLKTGEKLVEYPGLFCNIKRSLYMTTVCIVTDFIASMLVWILTKSHPELFATIIALHDINLCINVTCAICTFRNWRKIIFGFPILRNLVDTRDATLNYGQRMSSIGNKLLADKLSDNLAA